MNSLRNSLTMGMAVYLAMTAGADTPQPAMDHITRLQPAADAAKPLFLAAPEAAPADPDADRKDVTRRRTVRIDRQVFDAIEPDADNRLTLNLFDDASYEAATSHSVIRGERSYTLFGKLVGLGLADFMLVVEEDVVLLRVGDYENGRNFELRCVGEAPAFLYELSNHRPDECDMTSAPTQPPGSPGERGGQRCGGSTDLPADVGDRIDVLVLYTQYAREAGGGSNGMVALGFAAMDDMNQRLANSGRYTRVRVVSTQEVFYGESENASTDLTMLAGRTDGYMDEIHAWREQFHADLVVLIVNGLNAGGLAYRADHPGPNCGDGFAVVRRTAIPGGTFAHELGHTFGNCHSEEEGGCEAAVNSYCRGYRFMCGGRHWHTTMASDAFDPLSSRLPYYSTPSILFDCDLNGGGADEPLGDDEANAAQTIENSSWAIANNYYGDRICYVNGFSTQGQIGSQQFPYLTVRLAIADRWPGTIVNISGGQYHELGLYSAPVTLKSYNGTVRIQ